MNVVVGQSPPAATVHVGVRTALMHRLDDPEWLVRAAVRGVGDRASGWVVGADGTAVRNDAGVRGAALVVISGACGVNMGAFTRRSMWLDNDHHHPAGRRVLEGASAARTVPCSVFLKGTTNHRIPNTEH